MLLSKSMKLLQFIVLGRPGTVVYMHWNDYIVPMKDEAQLERLPMCV